MSVVAKFRVNEVINRAPLVEHNGQHLPIVTHSREGSEDVQEAAATVKLGAVYRGENDPQSEEDIAFSLATPYGELTMNVTNPEALEQFQAGDYFYVHFEPAE